MAHFRPQNIGLEGREDRFYHTPLSYIYTFIDTQDSSLRTREWHILGVYEETREFTVHTYVCCGGKMHVDA